LTMKEKKAKGVPPHGAGGGPYTTTRCFYQTGKEEERKKRKLRYGLSLEQQQRVQKNPESGRDTEKKGVQKLFLARAQPTTWRKKGHWKIA